MENLRIRYKRDINNNPIQTLVTVQDGDVLFWGISRCNPKDHVNKKVGKELATKRAQFAQVASEQGKLPVIMGPTFWRSGDGLMGCVAVSEVVSLLNYFDNKDWHVAAEALAEAGFIQEKDIVTASDRLKRRSANRHG